MPISLTWSFRTSWPFVPDRNGIARLVRPTAEILAILLAFAWIGFLLARPTYISVLSPSQEVEAWRAQSLSGVRGQTFVAPTDGLSRIDLDIDTNVPPGEWVQVRFELARDVLPRTTLASATQIFDRSREGWPIQLTFDPTLTSAGDLLYLRIESVLSSPKAGVFYRYSREDIDPQGEFLDLDQLRIPDQDLLMTVYRASLVPKPFAWGEALIGRAVFAAQRTGLAPPWLVILAGALAIAAALGAFAASVRLVTRLALVSYWFVTPLTTLALTVTLCAAALAILAWGEIPVGRLTLHLS